ncbi:hypothetical protein AAVH_21473, partial [Aphelenchoides avenae]
AEGSLHQSDAEARVCDHFLRCLFPGNVRGAHGAQKRIARGVPTSVQAIAPVLPSSAIRRNHLASGNSHLDQGPSM